MQLIYFHEWIKNKSIPSRCRKHAYAAYYLQCHHCLKGTCDESINSAATHDYLLYILSAWMSCW